MTESSHPEPRALVSLRSEVEAANLPWRAPHVCEDGDMTVLEWFGSGGSGRESARMLMQIGDEGVCVSVIVRGAGFHTESDHLKAYREFLVRNGWVTE